jgi:hypothetical protein
VRSQELGPERLGLAVAVRHTEHCAAAVGVDGDDDGSRDDVMFPPVGGT